MTKESKIKIFVAHHKPGYIYEDDIYVPIQVGKKISKVDLGILGDDTGDNISEKNSNYAELTAQYWVWKNYDLSNVDYVGFCHYRRYMTYCYRPNLCKYIFTHNPYSPIEKALIWQIRAHHEGLCFFDFNKDILRNNSTALVDYISRNQNDLYTAKREFFIKGNICKALGISTGSWLDFCIGGIRCAKRMKITKEIFLQMYPDYEGMINDTQEECKYYSPLHRHLFLMKSKLFLEYIERLFGYLFEVEKYINKHHIQTKGIYGKGETRFMGIFSEVFINYWKLYMERNRGIKTSSKSNLIFFTN